MAMKGIRPHIRWRFYTPPPHTHLVEQRWKAALEVMCAAAHRGEGDDDTGGRRRPVPHGARAREESGWVPQARLPYEEEEQPEC